MSITVANRSFQTAQDLEKLVIRAATEYELNGYVEDFDGTEVTDADYDALLKALKSHLPNSKALKGTSPSQAKTKGKTVKHDPPMTSIEKADGDDKKELYEKWLVRCENSLGVKPKIAQSYKRDGVALRINYVKGKLVSAGLRPRDGINGTDVTEHVKYIKGVPTKLPLPVTLSLNGEIECWIDDFAQINVQRDTDGEEPYKNPRNYTAGCMGRDDPEEVKNAKLRIAYYSITGFDEWADYYTSEVERAKWANSEEGLNLQEKGKGFFVQVRPHNLTLALDHLKMMENQAASLPYYTDGVILKVDDLDQQEQLGHHGNDIVNAPVGALAWKFQEETAEAVVSSIEWNASRTGRVVPTAIFDTPFVLADTENTRATCNNYGWMEDRGLGAGAKVRCKKGGKIIPNIMEVITPVKKIGEPKNCPTCNSQLSIVTSGSGNRDLICSNEDCGAKHIQGWIHHVSKLGGKGLGTATMEMILHTGKVKSLADLYELEVPDIQAAGLTLRESLLALATIHHVDPVDDDLELATNIGDKREKKQKVEAWKFFASLGIPGAGESAGKALIQHFQSFDKIWDADEQDLRGVSGIGETTAAAIVKWFKRNSSVVSQLLTYFELELPKTGKLSGKNFCLTGAFSQGKRFYQDLIEDAGGNVQSSVGSQTHYLVQEHGKNDGSPSEKEKKAKSIGVPVISVTDLQKLL